MSQTNSQSVSELSKLKQQAESRHTRALAPMTITLLSVQFIIASIQPTAYNPSVSGQRSVEGDTQVFASPAI